MGKNNAFRPSTGNAFGSCDNLILNEIERMTTTTKPNIPKKPRKDSPRELVETVVFVVVLVLVLKLFVVEAFVIPTGSMAETLLGYHKKVECEQCGYKFPLNASEEVEGRKGIKNPIVGYHCPNCDYPGRLKLNEFDSGAGKYYRTELDATSGDRVLVHKFMPIVDRGSVVVFKFPSDPQVDHVAQNYIKRLVGVGDETIATHRGKLFVHKSLKYPADEYPMPESPKDLWNRRYSFQSAPNAMAAFEQAQKLGFPEGVEGFELIRKPDDQLLAMRRIVYDNEFHAQDLIKLGVPPRWKSSGEGWGAAEPDQKSYSHTGGERGFLKYSHLAVKTKPLRDGFTGKATRVRDLELPLKPTFVTNFMGYNAGVAGSFNSTNDGAENADDNDHWVGDLSMECKVNIADPAAPVTLDLGRGPSRFQAQFANGAVKLVRTGTNGKEMTTRPTPMTKAGIYDLRFANVDCRLRVWVDDKPIDFGRESEYPFDSSSTTFEDGDRRKEGWTTANDIKEPAAIEVQGNVTVSKVVLYRDTYYTHPENKEAEFETFYVQPGHFLCFGDNSAQSHDGRGWGLVPERLMLGRAVFTFFPWSRIGFIR